MDQPSLRENPQHGRIIPMPNSTRALRVLVVDDEALLRWSIAELLRRSGHAVSEAMSATEARSVMSHTSELIDVAFLDFRLPDSNDLGLLEDMRRRFPKCVTVLMTAYSTPDLVQGALDRGAYRVLSKPFDMGDILALISEACRPD
jgi:DNA-binding NtrC family response regulator